MTSFWPLIILNFMLAIVIVFVERRSAAVTWAWLMILTFLPVVGFILYVLFGQNLSKRKLYKIPEEHRQRGALFLKEMNKQRLTFENPEHRFPNVYENQYRDMILLNMKHGRSYYSNHNDIQVYVDGHEKFEALLADIRGALHHIHMLYYIVRCDKLGQRLIAALTEKAKEGVEVRFLYDDIGSAGLKKRNFAAFHAAGGQTAAFFSSRIPYINFRLNYRNHRKLAMIDGKRLYIGGFNIGDEYLGLDERFGYWRDTHLSISGPAILQAQAVFMMDWNLASKDKFYPHVDYFDPAVFEGGQEGVQIVSAGPNNEREQIKQAYIKIIHSAKKTLYLQTPYFVPDESFVNALQMSAMSGVAVSIMLPETCDSRFVGWASHSYLGDLLKVGVRCYLYTRGFLHAKTIVADGTVCSVGTSNIDIRSFKLNFEINAVVYGEKTASVLKEAFERDIQDCVELTLTGYNERSSAQKVMESIARLVSPLL